MLTPSPPRRQRPPARAARRRPRRVPAPEVGRRHRRVRDPAAPEHADDARGQGVRRPERRRLLPGAPGARDRARRALLPDDRRRPRRRRPRGDPHRRRPSTPSRRCMAKKAQLRGDLRGRVLRDRRQGRRAARGPPRGPRAQRRDPPARPEHEPQRVLRVRGPARAVDRARSPRAGTRAGPCSRARSSGSRCRTGPRPATRSTSSSPTSPATSSTSPRSGVVACYIEGFKDGRSLMLAADHAAQLRKPHRDGEGRPHRRGHARWPRPTPATSPAPTRSSRRCSASSASPASTASTSSSRPRWRSPARSRRRVRDAGKGDGICVYAISGGTGAHMADMVAAAGLRLPAARPQETQRKLHDGLIPSYLRVSNPVDCGGPPVATQRGRQILDPLLADPNVDVLIVPITGAVDMFSEPFTRDLVDVAQTTDKPIFVIWGAPPGTDDTYYKRLLDGGLPVFRTFSQLRRRDQGVRRLLGLRPAATARPSPTRPPSRSRPRSGPGRSSTARSPGEALSEHDVEAAPQGCTASSRAATCCAPARPKRCGRPSRSATPW